MDEDILGDLSLGVGDLGILALVTGDFGVLLLTAGDPDAVVAGVLVIALDVLGLAPLQGDLVLSPVLWKQDGAGDGHAVLGDDLGPGGVEGPVLEIFLLFTLLLIFR